MNAICIERSTLRPRLSVTTVSERVRSMFTSWTLGTGSMVIVWVVVLRLVIVKWNE